MPHISVALHHDLVLDSEIDALQKQTHSELEYVRKIVGEQLDVEFSSYFSLRHVKATVHDQSDEDDEDDTCKPFSISLFLIFPAHISHLAPKRCTH